MEIHPIQDLQLAKAVLETQLRGAIRTIPFARRHICPRVDKEATQSPLATGLQNHLLGSLKHSNHI